MKVNEKAKELLKRMTVHHWTDVCDSEGAKQCALIAVDEIINTGLLEGTTTGVLKKYWKEVKQEIEKL